MSVLCPCTKISVLTYHRALEGIKDELLAISNHSNTPGYQKSEADMRAVCELAEVLRDATIEYQVRVNLGVSNQLVEFHADAQVVCTTKGNVQPAL